MEDDNTHLKFSNKHKILNFNLTLVKNKVHSANLFNSLLNIEDLSEPKKIQEKSRCYLLVKKINIKDKSNSYYSKGLNKIFNDVDKYLDHKYEGKKVIVGKECTSKGLKELTDYFFRKNRKRRTIRKNDLKSSLNIFNKALRSKASIAYLDQTKNNSSDTMKNSINKFSRRDYITKYPLSDYEMKKIFQEGLEREKQNKKERKDFSCESLGSDINSDVSMNNIKKINKIKSAKHLMNTERMNLNNMLHLQEKILKDRIKGDKIDKKISNKLMSAVPKEKSKLLMNDKKELIVIKKKEINREINTYKTLIKGGIEIKNWMSELRLNNKDKKKINANKKEIVFFNKNANSFLGSNDENKRINYSKIKIPSLFSKCRDKDKYKKNMYSYHKLKSGSVDNADNRKNYNKNESSKSNLYNSLFIKGKSLLEHEIKISKELLGKKKKIIYYAYNPEEISSVLFSKSKYLNNTTTPKAIINSIEIHNLGN